MAPSRKSFHESALNCCETILHLYSVFRTVLLHIDFFCLPRGRFPDNALQHRVNKIIQQRLLVEITKHARRFLAPELRLRPCSEGDSVAPASECPGRKVGVSTPIKFGVKSF